MIHKQKKVRHYFPPGPKKKYGVLIRIDNDVLKALANKRKNFESPNKVLKRMLNV